jgi:hypothetical protein
MEENPGESVKGPATVLADNPRQVGRNVLQLGNLVVSGA